MSIRLKSEEVKISKFDVDLVPHIEKYAAYVYRITVTFLDGTWKIYIGAHGSEKKRVSIYDSYDFSSEDEEFLADLRNPDNKVYFEIVMKGTTYDMFDLENQMLEEVDAGNPDNTLYYNNTNGGSRFTSQSAAIEAYIDSLAEKFHNGEFDQYNQILTVDYIKDQIEKYGQIQIRDDDEEIANDEYTKNLADAINVRFGKTDFLPSCLAFGQWGPNKDGLLWGDGTQRLTSTDISERGVDLTVCVLPKKEYKKIAGKIGEITQHMIDLCFIMNPLADAPLPMKPIELAKNIVARSKSLDDVKSDRQLRFLRKQNRVDRGAARIIRTAIKLWNNKVKAGHGNHYYDSTSPTGKSLIEAKVKEVQKKFPDDIVLPASSTSWGGGYIEGQIVQKKRPELKDKYPCVLKTYKEGSEKVTIRPIIHHPNTASEKEWLSGKGMKDRLYCEWLCNKSGYKLAEYDYVSLIAPMVTSKATK